MEIIHVLKNGSKVESIEGIKVKIPTTLLNRVVECQKDINEKQRKMA